MSPAFQDLKGIDNIYCPDKSCSREQDWLVHEPTKAALWALGSVMLFFGQLFAFTICCPSYSLSGRAKIRSATTFFAISMFLRAGLTHEAGDKTAMYIASMIFNYFAGVELSNILIANSIRIWGVLGKPSFIPVICSWMSRFVLSCIEFLLIVAGVYLMFHPYNKGSAGLGLRCLQAAVGILLVMAVYTDILSLACSWFIEYISIGSIISSIMIISLALLWNRFMFARTFFDLDNSTRDNELVFFMINYSPLMLGFLVILFLDEPFQFHGPNEDEDTYISI